MSFFLKVKWLGFELCRGQSINEHFIKHPRGARHFGFLGLSFLICEMRGQGSEGLQRLSLPALGPGSLTSKAPSGSEYGLLHEPD